MFQIAAIIPIAEFAGDELLLLEVDDRLVLPTGSMDSGERVLEAASRIVLVKTGLPVVPVRLVYFLEQANGTVLLGVQCQIEDTALSDHPVAGSIVALTGNERFEPLALREVLVEDLRTGFIRPVAHIVEPREGESGPPAVSW